jgi:hypothetical protein
MTDAQRTFEPLGNEQVPMPAALLFKIWEVHFLQSPLHNLPKRITQIRFSLTEFPFQGICRRLQFTQVRLHAICSQPRWVDGSLAQCQPMIWIFHDQSNGLLILSDFETFIALFRLSITEFLFGSFIACFCAYYDLPISPNDFCG